MSTSPSDVHAARAGHFYGVYILVNASERFRGRIYIGFTVNPVRRIRQHNREIKGGAWKTGGERGPWDMVLIVHGFATRLAALQFEWAWQQPMKSVRLKHLPGKRTKESIFGYRFRILCEMLNTGPWCRLPLVVRWLRQEYKLEFPIARQPPMHMSVAHGPIKMPKTSAKNVKVADEKTLDNKDVAQSFNTITGSCQLCEKVGEQQDSPDAILSCVIPPCTMHAHMTCLAREFLRNSDDIGRYLLPVSGRCPSCQRDLLWSEMVKQKKVALQGDEDVSEDEDELSQAGSQADEDFSSEHDDDVEDEDMDSENKSDEY